MALSPRVRGSGTSPDALGPVGGRRADLALVPLRMFLGATYAYAGLQKLASTAYLDPAAPASVSAQMRAASAASPIGGLLSTAGHHATAVGLLIAFGELAVGIGTLLGLWTRAAAVGGMALALSFLLAVSWHANPYYLGPDIVFLAAFTPFAIAAPSRWSVDAAVTRRLQLDRPPPATTPDERRRRFLETLTIAGWVGAVGLLGGGAAAALGRLVGDEPTGTADGTVILQAPTNTTPTTTGGTRGGGSTPGTVIGRVADVPVGGSAQFTDPATGTPAIVVQPHAGTFEACSSVCTHDGCALEYTGSVLHCPCHGAEFDPSSGAVLQGPAERALTTLTIRTGGDGTLSVAT